MRLWTRLIITILGTACALCTPTVSSSPEGDGEAEVTYRLEWDRTGITETEAGWLVGTNLGYTVHVSRGYVTSYGVELLECPEPEVAWRLPFGEGTARAGHSGDVGETALPIPVIESLSAPTDVDAAVVHTGTMAACQVHYVVARAPEDADGLPGDVDMVRVSVHLEGTWQRPGDESPTPFVIHTALAHGVTGDLFASADESLNLGDEYTSATVFVRRSLAPLFDDVDFGSAPADDAVAQQILTNLIDHTAIHAHGGHDTHEH